MIKVMDLVYYHHAEFSDPRDVIHKHAPSLGFASFIRPPLEFEFIKHMNFEGRLKDRDLRFAFFRGQNHFWYIPFKTHRYIKKVKPRIVIVEGLHFPLQLMFLRASLGRNTKIFVQHHGERPMRGIRGWFQQKADRFVEAYFFTSVENAQEWLDRKIIRDNSKCRQLLEASTGFYRHNKKKSLERTGLGGHPNFIWVGRLNRNKDPLTVLQAFKKYGLTHPNARLYMIYHEDDLLVEVREMIRESITLEESVRLIGKIRHEELMYWFSAADFYLSGSHKEGSGYALLEAIACGCIPVVTAIPSFKTIAGEHGFFYPPGDADALAETLDKLEKIHVEEYRNKMEDHFRSHLNYQSIARALSRLLVQI